ncbi:diguanylate cyclase (GGDEF) domain-containing protein [Ruminococcaceae bacterium FB2012]|nr:diguanylate cyclase (GGDEF) domain-containing protein [Ruminococcaceae bacterium FB2012]
MKRKTLAVCITGFDLEYEMDVVYGVHNKCKELGYDLLVFYNTTHKPERGIDLVISDELLHGEMSVYKLLDYDSIDGIVTFGESLLGEDTFFEIRQKAADHNIPFINVDDMLHLEGKRIVLSNTYAMSSVVEHLITVHGLKRIAFIGGFKDNNVQSEERLAAYKATLEKHGIPVDESLIFFGEFWRKAIECTHQILDLPQLPEAIVCANDTMAFFCMDELKERGYKIPEDIIVTGFDSLSECSDYSPTPTTVRRATFEAGEVAVELITGMWDGREPEDITYVDSVLVKGQSCGCVPIVRPDQVTYNQRKAYSLDFKQFTRYLLDMNMEFAAVEDSSELFCGLDFGCKIFKLNKLYVCISSDIEKSEEKINIDKDIPPWTVPDTMVSMYLWGHDVPIGTEFDTKQLIPGGIDDENGPVTMGFTPLYFKDIFLGYMAAELSTIHIAGDLLAVWMQTICNNAGSFYMNNKLKKAMGELELLNLHDALTGLYNRRGMKKYETELLARSIREGRYFSVICADVDGLKFINDEYGHEEGDNAISICSATLKEVFPADSICVRTGGDEFLIMAVFDDDKEPDRLIKKVYEIVDGYNAIPRTPYKLGCSCGHITIKADASTELSELKNEADSRMYIEKHRRKTVRKY